MLPRPIFVHKSFQERYSSAKSAQSLINKQLEILSESETPNGRMHVDSKHSALQGKLYKSHLRRSGRRLISLLWKVGQPGRQFIIPVYLTDEDRDEIDYAKLDLSVAYEILDDFRNRDHTAFEVWIVKGGTPTRHTLSSWPFPKGK